MLILETSAYMPSMSLRAGILPHTSWINLLRVIPSYKSESSTISAVIIDNQDVYAGNHLCPWYHPTTNPKIKIILAFSHSIRKVKMNLNFSKIKITLICSHSIRKGQINLNFSNGMRASKDNLKGTSPGLKSSKNRRFYFGFLIWPYDVNMSID